MSQTLLGSVFENVRKFVLMHLVDWYVL